MTKFFLSIKCLLIAGLLLSVLLITSANAGGLEGKEAPNFGGEIYSINGVVSSKKEKVDFNKDLKGKKVILLDFWSIYCVSCMQEIPKLIEIYNKYKDKDVYFIGVNLDTSPKRLTDHLKSKPQPYTVIMDKERSIMDAFKVSILPVTIIIGKDGKIKMYHDGYKRGDENHIEEVIKKLLE